MLLANFPVFLYERIVGLGTEVKTEGDVGKEGK